MQDSEETLAPGYRLDRYELVSPIGAGGMASVWLARLRGKRGFEKLFAIKTIKTELITDPHYQAMFLDEARIASRIIHPNVAQILELGEQDDVLYIVMEYIDGDSLSKIHRLATKRGVALPWGVSLRVVADMCAGLHAAHQLKDADGVSLGVVHRDVSPQNVLVTTDGSAKVIDFGLVKARGRSVGETAEGIVKGKIRYMAPEQVGSRTLDHRADVWAVGMCLYELLVGHVPYHTEDDIDVVKRLLSRDPLPSFDVALPLPLQSILRSALVQDPADRYESCAQMRRAIESAILELGLEAEHEHVAEFLQEVLPELAANRQSTAASAMQSSVPSFPAGASYDDPAPGEIGFAATEVSGRARRSAPSPEPRSARHAVESDPHAVSSSHAGRPMITTTSSPSLRAQLGERKRRGAFGIIVAAFVTAGAGAWILWPRVEPAPNGDVPAASGDPAAVDASPAPSSTPLAETSITDAASADDADVDDAAAVDLDLELDAGAAAAASAPKRAYAPRAPVPDDDEEVLPPMPTYNPAWSILTHPPDAAFLLAPSASASAAPAPPAATAHAPPESPESPTEE